MRDICPHCGTVVEDDATLEHGRFYHRSCLFQKIVTEHTEQNGEVVLPLLAMTFLLFVGVAVASYVWS